MNKIILSIILFLFSRNAFCQTDTELFDAWRDGVCNSSSTEFICPLQPSYVKQGKVSAYPQGHFETRVVLTIADVSAPMRQMVEEVNRQTASHGGDVMIGRLEALKTNLGFTKFACIGLGAACTAAAGAAVSTSGIWGILGIGACAATAGACAYVVDNAQTNIQKTIDEIKAACAQGDEQCYNEIIGKYAPPPPTKLSNGKPVGSAGNEGGQQGGPGPASGTQTNTKVKYVVVGGYTRCTRDSGGHLTCRTSF